jgi:hypothetical protein
MAQITHAHRAWGPIVDNVSQIGGPIQAGLAGTTGSQESTGRAQAKRERQRSEVSRRFQDALELTVAGVESAEAIHGFDENDEHEDQRKKQSRKEPAADAANADAPGQKRESDTGQHIDLTG